MNNRVTVQNNQSSTSAPIQNQMRSRPFRDRAKPEVSPTQQESAEGFGHNLANISISAPATAPSAPIQAKDEQQQQPSPPLIEGASSSTISQNAPIQCLLTDRNKSFFGRQRDNIANGQVNSVDLVTYDRKIGNNSRTGFFKRDDPNTDPGEAASGINIPARNAQLGNRAVATSKYADLLTKKSFFSKPKGPGTTIATTKFAEHNGELGTVSEKASGKSINGPIVNRRLSDNNPDDQGYLQNLRGPRGSAYLGKEKGLFTKKQGSDNQDIFYQNEAESKINQFDLSKPKTQKGLTDLQTMDALTGQVDRHGGNIFINKRGKVTGIDNDAAFGSGNESRDPSLLPNVQQGHNVGLPPLMDKATAKSIKHLTPDQLDQKLRDEQGAPLLNPQERAAAHDRLLATQQHIEHLKNNRGIVGRAAKPERAAYVKNGVLKPAREAQEAGPKKWDNNTHQTLVNGRIPNTAQPNNYLARTHEHSTRYQQLKNDGLVEE